MVGLKLNIVNDGNLVASHIITEQDMIGLNSKFPLSKIISLYKKIFGLDINKYTISEYFNNVGNFTIFIRKEDLQDIRDSKLSKLF